MDYRAGNLNNNAMRNNAMRKDDDLKPRVSLEKSGTTGNNAMRNSYAMRKTVNCAECGKPFERRTTWHKYCSELCKIQAYEQRTGKKWRIKKAV